MHDHLSPCINLFCRRHDNRTGSFIIDVPETAEDSGLGLNQNLMATLAQNFYTCRGHTHPVFRNLNLFKNTDNHRDTSS